MGNPFDQFDSAEPGASGNPFDQFDSAPAAKKQNKGIAADFKTDLKRGIQQLPGIATGLLDIPIGAATGEAYASKAADALGEITGFQPSKWAKDAQAEYSPERQRVQQEINQAWEGAGDAWDKAKEGDYSGIGKIGQAYLKNPAQAIGGAVVESLPSMLAGGIAGRSLATGAKLVSPVVGAGIGEGSVMAGQQMDQLTQAGADARTAAAASAITGVVGGGIGVVGGKAAQALGVVDPETALAGGATRAVANQAADKTVKGAIKEGAKRVAGGALSEGFFEELPQSVLEQALSNLAQGKPWDEGVARAAVEGTLAGSVMGGAFNVLPGREAEAMTKPAGEQPTDQQPEDKPAPMLALPAPTYTGTPGDQIIANDVERQAAIDKAQAESDAIWAARDEYERQQAQYKQRPMPTIINDPEPIQQRIDALMGISESRLKGAARTNYEKALANAFAEQVGWVVGKDDKEVPFTMGDYLKSKVAVADLERKQPVAQSPAAALVAEAPKPEIPVVGPLSAVANMAVQSGASTPAIAAAPLQNVVQQAGGQTDAALTQQVAQKAPQANGSQAGAEQGAAPATQGFDVSRRSDGQLNYLALNGQPGWKEAAVAELQRRGVQVGADEQAKPDTLAASGTPKADAAQPPIVTPQAARAAESGARQQAIDTASRAASGVLSAGGSEADANRAATDSLIDSMKSVPGISISQDAPAAVQAAKANSQNVSPASEGDTKQAPEQKAKKSALKSPTEGGPEDSIGWSRMTVAEREGLLIRAGYGGKGRALNLGGAGAINRAWDNLGKAIRAKLIAAHEVQLQPADQNPIKNEAPAAATVSEESRATDQEPIKSDAAVDAVSRPETDAVPAAAQDMVPAIAPQHVENGQAESATAAVVEQSLKKGAANSPLDLRQERDLLLKKIDAAIAEAPSAAEKGAWDRVNQKIDLKNNTHVEETIGYRAFDVPGDGKFKVLNLKEALQRFRDRVEASPGFRKPINEKPKTVADWQKTGRGGTEATIKELLDDGDYSAAVEYAKQIGKPLVFGQYQDGSDITVYTEAKPFEREGYDDFNMVSVRAFGASDKVAWAVVDLNSGLTISSKHPTRLKAIAETNKALDKTTPGQLAAAVRSAKDNASGLVGTQAELEQRWLANVEQREAEAQGRNEQEHRRQLRSHRGMLADHTEKPAEEAGKPSPQVSPSKTATVDEIRAAAPGKLTFEEAKARADSAWEAAKSAGAALQSFPKGAMGLTPDDVKSSPAYREAKKAYDDAAEASRQANDYLQTHYKKEAIAARETERTAKLAAVQATSEPAAAAEAPASLLDRINAAVKKLYDGELTADELRASFALARENRAAIEAELSKLTKAELLHGGGAQFAYRYKNDTKPEIVKAAYGALLDNFIMGESISYAIGGRGDWIETKARAIQARVDSATPESLAAYAEKIKANRADREQRREAVAKAIADPQTLEDYRRLLQAKVDGGKSAEQARMELTPEQRITLDNLWAEDTRQRRADRKEAAKTDVQAAAKTTSGDIIETKHTKTGEPLFVVKAAERVDRDVYNEWNAEAKKRGGYYSSYKGGGAIPGFTFKSREAADAFRQYLGGDVTAAKEAIAERRDAFADDRSQSAVERLNEMADRLEERADESLGRERKANTARRARFAASAEAAANSDKALAKTMRNIADAIASGTAKFLDRVRQKAQVEMLRSTVRSAQYSELQKKYPSYADQEKHRGEKPTDETADFARWPTFTADRADLARLARDLLQIDGAKLLGQRILKVADDVTDAYQKFAKDNLHKVSVFSMKRDGDETSRPAVFPTADKAEAAIARSGYRGKATTVSFKRGEHLVIMGPEMAREAGLWQGDPDKRITLTAEVGEEIVAKVKALGKGKVAMPYVFESVAAERARWKAMGIETAAEQRAALREFIALQEAPAAPDRIKELERAMVGRANDGLDFFPTPAETAQAMIEAADIKEGMAVLEPSAGMGHIAEQIRDVSGVDPDVVEFSSDRRELLEAKGFNVVGNDFMDLSPRGFTYGDVFKHKDGRIGILGSNGGLGSGRYKFTPLDGDGRNFDWVDRDDLEGVEKRGSNSGYDRIIMNPPFSNRRDAEHVQHAYSLLKPGGRLVAIMGEGVFYGQDNKAKAFRDWLEAIGGTSEKLEAGTFMDPSLPVNTSVNARMVVIEKPAGAVSPDTESAGNIADGASLSPADKAVYGLVAEGKSAADILKFIASASRNPFYRQVAKLLLKTGIAPNVVVGTAEGWRFNAGNDKRYAAAYNPKTDTVALFRAAAAERNVLHEMVHAATLRALGKKGMAAGQLRALFKHVQDSGKLRGMYGMTDVDEFIAEAFSNPKFQEALKQVPAPAGSSTLASAWHWFVRIVRGILGLPADQDNALSRAIEIGLDVMREDMRLRQQMGKTGDPRQSVPATEITGKEIERAIGRTIQEKATNWMRAHLQGKAFTNDATGWEISVGRKGINKTMTHGAKDLHARSVAALPGMLKHAVLVSSQPVRHAADSMDVFAVHHFYAPFSIDGEMHLARMVVKETRAGQKFYDYDTSDVISPAKPGADAILPKEGAATGNNAGPTISMATLLSHVKAEHGGNDPRFAKGNESAKAQTGRIVSADRDVLAKIFAGLDSRGLTKDKAEAAMAERGDAEQIQYIQDNFIDILAELEDAGAVEINCD